MRDVPSALVAAVSELWKLSARPPDLFKVPSFVRVREVCQHTYPKAGGESALSFALSSALERLGAPYAEPHTPVMSAHEAAARLDAAFTSTHGSRTHLCPLDLGGDLPDLSLGPVQVRSFTATELLDLVDPIGFERLRPHWKFDARAFAEFKWLTVAEQVLLDGEPGARTVPALFFNLGQDYGRIEPHRRRHPAAVEDALFALLLAPWEEWAEYRDINWRCFTVPWVHTVDHDLFVRGQRPPSHETLTWVPDFFRDEVSGEEVEVERPEYYRLNDRIAEAPGVLNDTTWRDVCAAMASPLLETPVAHFLVRAFLSDGIDEYIAHLTMIEAAIGLSKDKTASRRARVAALLKEPAASDTYQRLFQLRSEFVHGRKMADIPGAERDDARVLARRIAEALVGAAATPGLVANRDAFLRDLSK